MIPAHPFGRFCLMALAHIVKHCFAASPVEPPTIFSTPQSTLGAGGIAPESARGSMRKTLSRGARVTPVARPG